MNVQWWCSARGAPWDGSWQAYPGVWLFVIAVGALLWRLGTQHPSPRTGRNHAYPLSLLLLWLTLDWPVGPLGVGYLAWVHSAQFLVLAMVVPPLLLLGLDHERIALLLSRQRVAEGVVRRLTQPLFAIILFGVTMVLTHLPNIVDSLMATQLGAFALDLAWFVVGLIFWWPVIVRVPARVLFPPLLQMLYLFFGTQPHLYLAMWLLAADYPSYGTYELAPRITSVSALTDQQIAGALMLGFGATYVLGAISILYFQRLARES